MDSADASTFNHLPALGDPSSFQPSLAGEVLDVVIERMKYSTEAHDDNHQHQGENRSIRHIESTQHVDCAGGVSSAPVAKRNGS